MTTTGGKTTLTTIATAVDVPTGDPDRMTQPTLTRRSDTPPEFVDARPKSYRNLVAAAVGAALATCLLSWAFMPLQPDQTGFFSVAAQALLSWAGLLAAVAGIALSGRVSVRFDGGRVVWRGWPFPYLCFYGTAWSLGTAASIAGLVCTLNSTLESAFVAIALAGLVSSAIGLAPVVVGTVRRLSPQGSTAYVVHCLADICASTESDEERRRAATPLVKELRDVAQSEFSRGHRNSVQARIVGLGYIAREGLDLADLPQDRTGDDVIPAALAVDELSFVLSAVLLDRDQAVEAVRQLSNTVKHAHAPLQSRLAAAIEVVQAWDETTSRSGVSSRVQRVAREQTNYIVTGRFRSADRKAMAAGMAPVLGELVKGTYARGELEDAAEAISLLAQLTKDNATLCRATLELMAGLPFEAMAGLPFDLVGPGLTTLLCDELPGQHAPHNHSEAISGLTHQWTRILVSSVEDLPKVREWLQSMAGRHPTTGYPLPEVWQSLCADLAKPPKSEGPDGGRRSRLAATVAHLLLVQEGLEEVGLDMVQADSSFALLEAPHSSDTFERFFDADDWQNLLHDALSKLGSQARGNVDADLGGQAGLLARLIGRRFQCAVARDDRDDVDRSARLVVKVLDPGNGRLLPRDGDACEVLNRIVARKVQLELGSPEQPNAEGLHVRDVVLPLLLSAPNDYARAWAASLEQAPPVASELTGEQVASVVDCLARAICSPHSGQWLDLPGDKFFTEATQVIASDAAQESAREALRRLCLGLSPDGWQTMVHALRAIAPTTDDDRGARRELSDIAADMDADAFLDEESRVWWAILVLEQGLVGRGLDYAYDAALADRSWLLSPSLDTPLAVVGASSQSLAQHALLLYLSAVVRDPAGFPPRRFTPDLRRAANRGPVRWRLGTLTETWRQLPLGRPISSEQSALLRRQADFLLGLRTIAPWRLLLRSLIEWAPESLALAADVISQDSHTLTDDQLIELARGLSGLAGILERSQSRSALRAVVKSAPHLAKLVVAVTAEIEERDLASRRGDLTAQDIDPASTTDSTNPDESDAHETPRGEDPVQGTERLARRPELAPYVRDLRAARAART